MDWTRLDNHVNVTTRGVKMKLKNCNSRAARREKTSARLRAMDFGSISPNTKMIGVRMTAETVSCQLAGRFGRRNGSK